MNNFQQNSTASLRADGSVWTATGLEPQVFLDRSGRRAVRVRVGGAVAAIAAAGWLGGIVSGASGFAALPPVTLSIAQKPALVSHHARTPVQLAALRRALAADPS
ncbi:MAG: hypothetical protein NVSMB51_10700 [Solirubrobacteraceae bacterium]